MATLGPTEGNLDFGWLFLLRYAAWLYENYPEKFIETFGPLSKIQTQPSIEKKIEDVRYCCTDRRS